MNGRNEQPEHTEPVSSASQQGRFAARVRLTRNHNPHKKQPARREWFEAFDAEVATRKAKP